MFTTYMAVAMAFGLCSAIGLLYGPVHNILPLLMIGLGVDDMFVIVQCWQNLDHQVGAAVGGCPISECCHEVGFASTPEEHQKERIRSLSGVLI